MILTLTVNLQVTNAMFYQGKEANQEQLRGVEIGPVEINYR